MFHNKSELKLSNVTTVQEAMPQYINPLFIDILITYSQSDPDNWNSDSWNSTVGPITNQKIVVL